MQKDIESENDRTKLWNFINEFQNKGMINIFQKIYVKCKNSKHIYI